MLFLKRTKAFLASLLSATLLFPCLMGFSTFPVTAQGEAKTEYFKAYPKADYETFSSDYEVKVNGTAVDTVAYFEYASATYRYSYAHLAFEGTATFSIKNLHGEISDYNLSPHSYGIKATVDGDTLTFDLTQADSRYLVLRTWVGKTRYELFVACDPKIDFGLEELKKGNFVNVVEDLHFDNTGKTKLSAASGNNATGALQNAVNELSAKGGGTLYFPAGTYSFVYLDAKDNVTIYLDEGAYLRGTGERTDYTWNDTGVNGRQGRRLIDLKNAKNFAIIGSGTIDGNIIALSYPGKNVQGTPPSGPAPAGFYPDGWNDFRTGLIDGDGAQNITLKGVTVKEATGWTFNITNSTNVKITNVKMLNDYEIVHSDGYDLVTCQDVLIDDCLGVCGDDVFCPKAANSSREMKDYLITDGVAYARGGAGCKVGVQSNAKTTNIVFDNIDVVQGYRAFCIAHDEGSGAWSDITFRNIRTEEIYIENTPSGGTGQYATAAFVIWTLGGGQGRVSNVTVENCTIENTKGQKATIKGESAAGRISGVTIKNLTMDGITINRDNYQSKINVGANVENLTIENDSLQLTDWYTYEAEVSTKRTGNLSNAESDLCSGGYMVSAFQNGAALTIDVFAETAGEREVALYYAVSGTKTMSCKVGDADAILVECTGTSMRSPAAEPVIFTAYFEKGMNAVVLSGVDSSLAPNVDKLEVAMLSKAEKEAVAQTVAAIDALPEKAVVTLQDTAAVTAAIEGYNSLITSQKFFVTNADKMHYTAEALTSLGATLPAYEVFNVEEEQPVLPEAPVTTPSEENNTQTPSTDDPSADPADESSKLGMILGIVAGAVALAAAAVVAVVSVKKKKK